MRAPTSALLLSLATALYALPSEATRTAHLLRVDPRTAVEDDSPIVTTLVDLADTRRLSEVLAPCAQLSGDAQLDCLSEAVEKPGALGQKVPFPKESVLFTVKVDGADVPAEYLGHTRFGDTQSDPGVGTAWLIVLDADEHGKDALDELATVARRFIQLAGPNDFINLIVLGDKQVISDSSWLGPRDLKALETTLASVTPVASKSRTRPLLSLLRQSVTDAFRTLASPREGTRVPLHQAIVFLSSGYGGGDPGTTGPLAEQFQSALSQGRLAEGNAALPKTPVPMVSVMTPSTGFDESRQLARTFMQNLANPEIGGFFTAIRDGQAKHAERIVDTVRARFAELYLVRFRLSCLAPSTTQSFSLLFPTAEPPILGDASFQNVPVGFDPSTWPLDVDAELTRQKAMETETVHPGGKLKVFGSFCWGGDLSRPEIYFLPPGESLSKGTPGEAKRDIAQLQKRLISMNLRGTALSANESFAEFQIPDSDAVLHGQGDNASLRFVVVDRGAKRTSGLTERSVLELRGRNHPFPLWPLLGGALVTLLGLLGLGLYLRRSSQKTARASIPPGARMEGSPYISPAPVRRSTRELEVETIQATLECSSGRFVLLKGADLRVGRDGTRCAAVIPRPEVSGLHATFRIQEGRVWIRDEGSTSGTRVAGELLPAGSFVPLDDPAEVTLGPETLRVTIKRS